MTALGTPFLIGEFQPWTGTGSAGGLVTRHTFDVYNMYGWATAAWSYKLVTHGGSEGGGSGWGWGVVTNSSDGGGFSDIDIASASAQDIEAHFALFATQPLLTHPGVLEWMNYRPEIGERIEAEIFVAHEGTTMEACSDVGGGFMAGSLDPGDSLTYLVDVPAAGPHDFSVRAASAAGGGDLTVLVDGAPVGSLTVADTGGWQDFQTFEGGPIELEAGVRTITLEIGSGQLNLNWWMLTAD
jgi:hypothetical protein